ADEALVYFRYDLPWPVADRDYTARYRWALLPTGRGRVEIVDADGAGPPVDGAVRVTDLRACFTLEARADDRTRVRYRVHMDRGGHRQRVRRPGREHRRDHRQRVVRQPEGGEQQAILGEDDEVHADADGERPRETARLTDEPARVVLRAREDVHPATYDAQPVEPRRARRRGHEPAPLAETPDGRHHADGG